MSVETLSAYESAGRSVGERNHYREKTVLVVGETVFLYLMASCSFLNKHKKKELEEILCNHIVLMVIIML